MFGRKSSQQSGQQRRSAEVSRLDRAGRAALDARPENRSTTVSWSTTRPARAWWRSS